MLFIKFMGIDAPNLLFIPVSWAWRFMYDLHRPVSGLNLDIKRQGFGIRQQQNHHGSTAALSFSFLDFCFASAVLSEKLLSNFGLKESLMNRIQCKCT